jgi:hypothetical protein
MLKLQTATVLQILKKTSFLMQNSVDVNAELTSLIAPLLLYQTSSTVDANALVGKVRVKMFKQQTTTVLQITKPTSFSMQTTAAVNAESICQIVLQLNQTF